MYKNEFQGGHSVDVFSVQGKDPLSKLKLHGTVRKEFDNDLRTFILVLQGDSSRSSLTFPKNSKQTLHLTQQYVVFQLLVQAGQSFSIEVAVTSQSNMKLRLILSSSSREIVVTTHHVKMPCSVIIPNIWLNLCLDLKDLVHEYFEGSVFDHVDSVMVSANSKLRRIFTLKDRPSSPVDIPKSMKLPPNVSSIVQIIDCQTFLDANVNMRSGTGNPERRTPHKHSTNSDNSHIAFGSRVRSHSKENNNTSYHDNTISSSNGTQDSSRSSKQRFDSGTDTTRTRSSSKRNSDAIQLSSQGHSILPSKPTNKQFMNNKIEKGSNISTTDINNSEHSINNKQIFIQPKPPDKRPSDARRKNIRRPRVKSADLARGTLPVIEKPQIFSKSADSRNRRRPSVHDVDSSSEHEKPLKLPPIQMKKEISRSTFELERLERNDEEEPLPYKSKSLTVLPNIEPKIEKNYRYKSPAKYKDKDMFLGVSKKTSSSREFASSDVIKPATEISDNVFTDDDTCEELMKLADDQMVDDYLKERTRSSCHDDNESTYSSGVSTNSEFYTFSSRPRSVTGHQQKEQKPRSSKQDNKDGRNDRTISSSSERGKATDSLSSSSGLNTESNDTGEKPQDITVSKSVEREEKDGIRNETFSVSKSRKDFDNNNNNNNLELSWEYSESTSMLVIPSDLKRHVGNDEKTEVDISLDVESKKGNTEEPLLLKDNISNAQQEQQLQYPQQQIQQPQQQQQQEQQPSDEDQINSSNEQQQEQEDHKILTNENGSHEGTPDAPIKSDGAPTRNNTVEKLATENQTSNQHDENNNAENFLQNSYVMKESYGSDTMSWLHASNDPGSSSLSVPVHNTTLDKLKSSPNMILKQKLKDQLGSMLSKDDSDEGLSDCSDDTTYTDAPPRKFRNYRYQDEIKSIGSTLDLSATIPATPRVGDQARSGQDENNNTENDLNGSNNEEFLDLMYDPVLNCYYDPVTHKYYELN